MTDDPARGPAKQAFAIPQEGHAALAWLSFAIYVAVLVAYGLDRAIHLSTPAHTSPDAK